MSVITMGHGGGGSLTDEVIRMARAAFSSVYLDSGLDSAILPAGKERIAFTTDSYVVRPLFFPGGDIGRIAVCGTVNDLSVVGAKPRYISCGLILEEGFPFESLGRIFASMAFAAKEAGVEIVTGDTKVVEKGHGDGIYINTAGIRERRRPGRTRAGSGSGNGRRQGQDAYSLGRSPGDRQALWREASENMLSYLRLLCERPIQITCCDHHLLLTIDVIYT